jgi:spermidine synthase
MKKSVIFLCFLFSGASGLIYEVVWTRFFEFVVGCSHQSMAIVVSTFMGGLAVGSLFGGKLADRSRSPLRLYGWLVIATGAYCLAIPGLLELLKPVFGAVYRLHDGQPGHPLFVGVKVLASVAILIAPTTFMGATLPVLTRHLSGRLGEVGGRLGRLYAMNTLGAVAGAWSSHFVLIRHLGLRESSALAAAIDIAVGIAVLLLARLAGRQPSPCPPASPANGRPAPGLSPDAAARPLARPTLVVAAFGISGLVDMCLQLAWTRSLVLSLGNSTYAFSVIVGIFILGLSVGSAIASTFAHRLAAPQAALGWVMFGAATLAALTIPVLGVFAPEFSHWLAWQETEVTFSRFLLLGSLWAFAIIFPSTVCMGMTFPLVGRLTVKSLDEVGRTIGGAYCANTVGSIVGTLLVGFVLLPLTGHIWAPLYLAVAIGLAAALPLVLLDPALPARRPRRAAIAGALLAALVVGGFLTRPSGVLDSRERPQRYWDPLTLSLGPFLYYSTAKVFRTVEQMEASMRSAIQTLYYRDGEAASVGVFRIPATDHLYLKISGKVEAGLGPHSLDMPTQLLSGHLPMLARPHARRVLNVGLGSGVTMGSMSLYPEAESLDSIELSREVVESAIHFKDATHDVTRNSRVKMIIGDGRNHLQHTSAVYDVISSEPSNFWIAGLGNLFTGEFYELVKSRLAPDGVFCQWVQAYGIRKEDFCLALRTLTNRFRHVTLWTPGSDTLFIASMTPVEWSGEWIARCLEVPAIARDLSSIGVDRPEALFRYLGMEDPQARQLAGTGLENLDNHPRLEYSAPLSLLAGGNQSHVLFADDPPSLSGTYVGFSSLEDLRAYRRRGTLLHRLRTLLGAERPLASRAPAAAVLVEIASWRDPMAETEAARVLDDRVEPTPEWKVLVERAALVGGASRELATLAARLKEVRARPAHYQAAAEEALPGDWSAHLLLASKDLEQGDALAALQHSRTAKERGAPAGLLAQVRGTASGMLGDLEGAERSFREALEATPAGNRGEILYNLGFTAEKKEEYEKAIEYQRRSLAEKAEPVRGNTALARSLRAAKRPAEALQAAEKAIAAAAGNADALHAAAMALLDLNEPARALRYLERAEAAAPGRFTGEIQALKAAAR